MRLSINPNSNAFPPFKDSMLGIRSSYNPLSESMVMSPYSMDRRDNKDIRDEFSPKTSMHYSTKSDSVFE